MLTKEERKVLDLIDENKEEITECLRELISFRTITPSPSEPNDNGDRSEHTKLQELIYKILKGLDFTVDIWEVDPRKLDSFPGSAVIPDRDLSNMPVIVGKLRGKGRVHGKSLILNGHYDVVPPGILGNWSHEPFKGDIEDNKIFGRGACDMKGGIAAMVNAIKFIQKAEIKLNGDLIVETVPEEEITEMGTLACCEKGYKADAAIIPEPTNMNVLVAMRGAFSGKITVFGRAGHATLTQPHWSEGGAVNAISKAVKIIQALEELTEEWRNRPDKRHKFLDPDIILPTIINGGDWIVKYPEKVEIVFNGAFIPGTLNMREIEDKIMSVARADPWMKEHLPKLETNPWVYGAEVDEDEPIIKTTIEAAKELNVGSELVGFGSLTDAVHLINYSKVPTISIGPNSKPAHMADEFVDINELTTLTKIIALTILRWCGHS